MTTIAEALVAYVNADTAIAALEVARFYPDELPQGATVPATVYQRLNANGVYAHGTARGLTTARYQFTHWAASVATAQALADAFRHRLDGFHGTLSTVRVDRIWLEDGPNLPDPTTRNWRILRDYFVQYAEV